MLAGQEAVALVSGVLDEAGINYLSVTGRTKTVASFAEKAARTQGGAPLYSDPAAQITDAIGVRVITYVGGDVEAVAGLLGEQVVVRDDRDLGQETASEGRFGYASRHLLISLDAVRESHPDLTHLRGRVVQVQLRTVLQHAWAEFEHDIRYKGSVPAEHAREFDRRFTLAAGLLELADTEFATIRERLRGLAPAPVTVVDDDPRIDARELAAFLAGQYSDAAGRVSTTTAGSRGCSSSSASPRSSSWARCCARRRPTSTTGWTTATHRAPYAVSTTRCWRPTANGSSTCTATPTVARHWARASSGSPRTPGEGRGEGRGEGQVKTPGGSGVPSGSCWGLSAE